MIVNFGVDNRLITRFFFVVAFLVCAIPEKARADDLASCVAGNKVRFGQTIFNDYRRDGSMQSFNQRTMNVSPGTWKVDPTTGLMTTHWSRDNTERVDLLVREPTGGCSIIDNAGKGQKNPIVVVSPAG